MKTIKVTGAEYVRGYKIRLKFENGSVRLIDLKDELWGPVFEPLKDKKKFKAFTLNPFTIEWDNGADFAPEFLYENSKELKETEVKS